MANWTQYTYVDWELKYEPKTITADKMVETLMSCLALKKAGSNIEVDQKTGYQFETTEITVTRVLENKTLFYRFVKQ